MLKAVVDTNVFVAGIISPKGFPAKIINAWKKRRFELVVSPEIIEEVREVLFQPKIRNLSSWTDRQREEFIENLIHAGIPASGSLSLKIVGDDPDDDKFIIAALEEEANYILTGDAHLLKLGSYKGIKILTPKEFVKIMEQE